MPQPSDDPITTELAHALRGLLDLLQTTAKAGNAVDDEVKIMRSTATDLLESEPANRARRALDRWEWR